MINLVSGALVIGGVIADTMTLLPDIAGGRIAHQRDPLRG
jgi:hypothetical protein